MWYLQHWTGDSQSALGIPPSCWEVLKRSADFVTAGITMVLVQQWEQGRWRWHPLTAWNYPGSSLCFLFMFSRPLVSKWRREDVKRAVFFFLFWPVGVDGALYVPKTRVPRQHVSTRVTISPTKLAFSFLFKTKKLFSVILFFCLVLKWKKKILFWKGMMRHQIVPGF